ncbi:MAG: hypothetical protein C4575_04425 [Desulforudis sp.]|jgi:Na+/melibiose symporter-like transporter|nr:MAG: hypothetical protein C4575_04425 [Desulforudis sp.]
MTIGMTILMIIFAFAAASIIIYFNHYLAALPGFSSPPFIIAFCIGVAAVISFGILNAIARGGKGESTGHDHH